MRQIKGEMTREMRREMTRDITLKYAVGQRRPGMRQCALSYIYANGESDGEE